MNWVLDLDIRKYFDSVDHDRLLKTIRHRVRDGRILRLIQQWLKVGYVEEGGRRIRSQRGTAEGAVVSPLLANVYLHYAFDQWSVWWRKYRSEGDMIIVRYADDGAPRRCEGGLYDCRERRAVEEMAVGPPESGCRTRFQTA